jgi:hypothetical protein
VCFALDEKLELIYCNPAWDRFAVQNGAPHLLAEKVLGAPVLRSTSGELSVYYQSLYDRALADRKPREHDFHCSSADVERLMRMHVYPLRSVPALLIVCSLRVERPHAETSGEPIQGLYRNEHGFIVMCSNCRRTHRAGVEPETWDWISDFVAHQPPLVSHSLCGLCLEYYHPAG